MLVVACMPLPRSWPQGTWGSLPGPLARSSLPMPPPVSQWCVSITAALALVILAHFALSPATSLPVVACSATRAPACVHVHRPPLLLARGAAWLTASLIHATTMCPRSPLCKGRGVTSAGLPAPVSTKRLRPLFPAALPCRVTWRTASPAHTRVDTVGGLRGALACLPCRLPLFVPLCSYTISRIARCFVLPYLITIALITP